MSIGAWWPKLLRRSRDCLIDNNGDVVPPDPSVETAEQAASTGLVWWVDQRAPQGLLLSDKAIDRVDEVANDGTPEPRAEDRSPTSWTGSVTEAPRARRPVMPVFAGSLSRRSSRRRHGQKTGCCEGCRRVSAWPLHERREKA